MDGSEFLFFFLIRLLLAYGIGRLGRKRTIGFGWAFVLGIISPLLALIVALCCKKQGPTFVDVTSQKQPNK